MNALRVADGSDSPFPFCPFPAGKRLKNTIYGVFEYQKPGFGIGKSE